jgi:hypothetical protein
MTITRNLVVLVLALTTWVAPARAQIDTASRGKLQALDGEPSCQEVQEMALKYFNISGKQVDSLRTRAKTKSLLPVLEVSGGYTDSDIDEVTNDEISYPSAINGPWLIKAAAGNAWDVRGKATWDLPRLVFNSEVLDVASLAGLMQGVLKEATRLYYMRRRLQVDLILSPPSDPATLLSKQMRLDELTSLIDAITGGWFSQELTKRRPAADDIF